MYCAFRGTLNPYYRRDLKLYGTVQLNNSLETQTFIFVEFGTFGN